jgi:hypothetical protein
MTDDTAGQTSPADGPSEPRPPTPAERPLPRRAAARTAGRLRGFWYGFQRLFGLDSCSIEPGPGARRPPAPPSATGRAHQGWDDGAPREGPGVRSGRGQ